MIDHLKTIREALEYSQRCLQPLQGQTPRITEALVAMDALEQAMKTPVSCRHFTDEQICKAMDGSGFHFYGVSPGTPLYTVPPAQQAQPVLQIHPGHLRPADNGGPWCREVLVYSGDNEGDLLNGQNPRVKLYTAAPVAQQYEAGDMASAAAQGFRDGVASVTQQEPVDLIVRNCCEAEKADPDHPDTICISVQDLTAILEQHAAPVAQQPQARPDFHDEWTGYLKDGETPFERFRRERKDLAALTKLYQRALEENEQLKVQQAQTTDPQLSKPEPLTSYVQPVPDHCDRIVWRNRYYHLPLKQAQAESVPQDVLKDAQRYQWLRTHQLYAKVFLMPCASAKSLDNAVDFEMAKIAATNKQRNSHDT